MYTCFHALRKCLLTRNPLEILGTLVPLYIFVISKIKGYILNEVLVIRPTNPQEAEGGI